MKVLKTFEFKAGATRPAKYPWEEWLDGQIRQLEATDFGGSMPKAFPAAVRKQAKARGLRVRCQKTPEGGIVIEAYKPESEEGGEVKAATGKGKGKK